MSHINLVSLSEAFPFEDKLFSNVGHGWEHATNPDGAKGFRKDVMRDFPILRWCIAKKVSMHDEVTHNFYHSPGNHYPQ
jgi:hypothetical protein